MSAACSVTYDRNTLKVACSCGEAVIPLVAIASRDDLASAKSFMFQILHESKVAEARNFIETANPHTKVYLIGKDPLPSRVYLSVLQQLKKLPHPRMN